MKRMILFAVMVSVSGVLVTGCGGAGSPAINGPQDSRSPVAQTTEAQGAEVAKPEVSRSMKGGADIDANGWPASLTAQQNAHFEGILRGTDGPYRWKGISGLVTIRVIREKNNAFTDVYTDSKMSNANGTFSFDVKVPGVRKDRCFVKLEFAGNGLYNAAMTDKSGMYTLN